jgi:hypothetical protein
MLIQPTILSKVQKYTERNYQCLVNEPQLFFMRKSARFELIRDAVEFGSRIRSSSDFSETNASQAEETFFPDLDVERVVEDLRADGLAMDLQLPQYVIQELMQFVVSSPCYGDRDPSLEFDINQKEAFEAKIGRSLRIGSYLDSHIDHPTFQKLITDPKILAIASQYLSAPEPKYLTSEIAWSFPAPADAYEELKAAQVYHYDIDDYKCIKFFFYLTDVDEQSGPHACIRKSHRNKKLMHQMIGQRCASISDDKLLQMYGEDNAELICGNSGSGFVEDVFCFHKGVPPQHKTRLLLQFEYTMNYYKGARMYT